MTTGLWMQNKTAVVFACHSLWDSTSAAHQLFHQMKWLRCVMGWNALPMHTSPDGKPKKGDGEKGEKMETQGRRQENNHTHTQHWKGKKSCIGLCCPEAEEESLTFPLLQAPSDPWFLFFLWLQANSDNEEDGEGQKREERGMTLTEKENSSSALSPTDSGPGGCQETNFLSFLFQI